MSLFHRGRHETVALIDVGANAVAGAYVRYTDKTLPTIVYASRLPIEVQANEEHSTAMLRALEILGTTLVQEGIPALVRATGRHAVDTVLVSIDSPWQETAAHTEPIGKESGFIFTKTLVADAVQKVSQPKSGMTFTDVSVMGTVLNGYAINNSYGKRVRSASVIVLTSAIDTKVVEGMHSLFERLYPGKRVVIIAGTSLRYQAMRVAFPHEHEALIVDATGPLPETSLVRNNFLVAISETPESLASMSGVRAEDFMRGFAELAKSYPLPRTMFLLARDAEMDTIQKTLNAVNFSTLWFSDTKPKIVPLLAKHLAGLVQQKTTIAPDLPLLLMALYYRYLERA